VSKQHKHTAVTRGARSSSILELKPRVRVTLSVRLGVMSQYTIELGFSSSIKLLLHHALTTHPCKRCTLTEESRTALRYRTVIESITIAVTCDPGVSPKKWLGICALLTLVATAPVVTVQVMVVVVIAQDMQ
jgi:hypothetical protein